MALRGSLIYITAGETRNVSIDFAGKLDSGELLTGTPTVEEVGSSALTITNKQVNATSKTINGRDAAAGEAVQFRVSGLVAGTSYLIKVTVSTDDGQVLIFYQPFKGR